MYTLLILSSVALNAGAQIFLKLGLQNFNFSQNIFFIFKDLLLNIYVVLGILFYGISIVIWMYVLSKVDVSYAYPFLSLGFLVVMFFGIFFLGEVFNIYKILGVIFIVIGVILIYKFN